MTLAIRYLSLGQYISERKILSIHTRKLASVKELAWCATKGSPHRRSASPTHETDHDVPIERFGIVAAMSKNRVIGINGTLPWNLPEDRRAFKELTAGKLLIIGRRTLQEEENRRHINHAAQTIVVSRNLQHDDELVKELILVRSFSEALNKAKELVDDMDLDKAEVNCWVAGGERLFQQALVHPSALTLHLTVVDRDIDLDAPEVKQSARFPESYRWEYYFKLCATIQRQDSTSGLQYSQRIYNRV